MAVLIFLGCLLGGIAIGLPIAWALLLCGAALMFWLDMFDVQIMAQTLVNGADSFSLLAIPFFVLAGEIMNAGGLSKRIVDLPMMVSDLLQPLVDSPRLLFIVIMVAILIVGMVMDLTPTVLILTPVLMPLVKEAGIDPIYFGVMFIINCSIGLITPPIGNVLNVISGVAKLKFDDAVRGVFPYVLVLYSLLVAFVFIPDLIILPLKWIN
ncbi:SLC13 family permease [Escherichia coli]|uniref:SLC13 family permease n=1 Tax=Escherichia coli TaxID=562 RepID=UPI00102D4BB2|nr:SLC13 family permease [Escherichia coli]RZW00471.1 TRAP transporter large permease subunit [Escherichia coli]